MVWLQLDIFYDLLQVICRWLFHLVHACSCDILYRGGKETDSFPFLS